jgi:dihydrofolate reductase
MSIVRFHMTISLDGYTSGLNQRPDKPFGDNTDALNDWVFRLRSFQEMRGLGGGETGPSDDVARERMANLGAVVMGRNMFGGGTGPWPEPRWDGWWGSEPPFHAPVFVLTHHPRPPQPMSGGTTFHFVTDGISAALGRAREAAGSKDVVIGGGATTVRQYLAAGAIDEFEIHVVPTLVGAGERLFDDIGGAGGQIQQVRVVEGEGVTHIKYRVDR